MFSVYLWKNSKIGKMKSKWSLAVFCIMVLLIGSCKTEVTQREDYKKVMEVHDVAMARMGEMHELKKELRSWIETSIDSVQINEARSIIKLLDDADEGMMSWMSEFRAPETGSDDLLKSYFESEQVKVDKVSLDINESISRAEKFLK